MTAPVTRLGGAAALLVAAALAVTGAFAQAAPHIRPERIVSLNLCTDELLLRLADPSRIASVTWLARDRRSANRAAAAAAVPVNQGAAEEILSARPDLVLAGRYTTRQTVALLERVGTRVVEIGAPNTLAEVRAEIRAVAAVIDETARGDALVAELDRRLAAIRIASGSRRPRALVLSPNGFTVGPGSLVDEILRAAGLDNVAADLGVGAYGPVPIETAILERVDLLIADAEGNSAPSLATEILRHPALIRLGQRITVADVPSRLWSCPGPEIAEAVALLASAAEIATRKGLR